MVVSAYVESRHGNFTKYKGRSPYLSMCRHVRIVAVGWLEKSQQLHSQCWSTMEAKQLPYRTRPTRPRIQLFTVVANLIIHENELFPRK